MPIERFSPETSALADKLAALRALAPEAFTADGQLDWDALRTAFGDAVDDRTPGFGLRWPGKRAAQRAAHTPVRKTLTPPHHITTAAASTKRPPTTSSSRATTSTPSNSCARRTTSASR